MSYTDPGHSRTKRAPAPWWGLLPRSDCWEPVFDVHVLSNTFKIFNSWRHEWFIWTHPRSPETFPLAAVRHKINQEERWPPANPHHSQPSHLPVPLPCNWPMRFRAEWIWSYCSSSLSSRNVFRHFWSLTFSFP